MTRRLILAGPVAPPSGGVASHLVDLRRSVAAAGGEARFLSTARAHVAQLLLGLAAARARGDLVHLHTNGHNAGSWRLIALVGVAARDAMLTLHSGLAPAYLRTHSPRALDRFGAIVCASPAIAAALAGAGVAASRLVVAPAFSAGSLPLPIVPAGLAAVRARHRPLLAAAVGEGREYGSDVLVDGFQRLIADLPGAGLILFGPAARAPSVVRAVAAAGLAARVHHFGDLSRGEALGVMAAADLFVRPTRADGDAVSVREALALGRPVLASDSAARPAGTICFVGGDPISLADRARHALAAPPPAPQLTDGIQAVLDAYRARGVALTSNLSAGGA